MSTHDRGQVITFYSFKGGTGRTQALANAAFLLACSGRRVCAIDWDLEAPGLHRYFLPFLADPELQISRGLIDFLWDLSAEALTPERTNSDGEDSRVSILDYTVAVDWEFPSGGTLDFVPAGRQTDDYPKRVTSFQWDRFYERLGGGRSMNRARDQLRSAYAYSLIDSRTGVSDTSGICTLQMPDRLVACYALNRQSIAGVAKVLETVSDRPRDRSLRIFPLEMRVEKNEKAKLDSARKLTRPIFKRYIEGEQADYWEEMEVVYWPYYAFEECLAVFGDDPDTRTQTSMIAAMERITAKVASVDVKAPRILEAERARVLRLYALAEPVESSPLVEDSASLDLWAEVEARFDLWQDARALPGVRWFPRNLLPAYLVGRLATAGQTPPRLRGNPSFMLYLGVSRDWVTARRRALVLFAAWLLVVTAAAVATGVVAAGLTWLWVALGGIYAGLVAAIVFVARFGRIPPQAPPVGQVQA